MSTTEQIEERIREFGRRIIKHARIAERNEWLAAAVEDSSRKDASEQHDALAHSLIEDLIHYLHEETNIGEDLE